MQFDNLMAALADEQTAIDYFTRIRWKHGAFCPLCCSTSVIHHFSDRRTHKCGKCRKRFSIKVRTIFEDSKVQLRKWFKVIRLVTAHEKGIASTQLAEEVGVTQKTAWLMTRRLRQSIETRSFNRTLDDGVDAEETFIGSREERRVDRMRGRRERPLGLDMPFGEALERFIGVDRNELTLPHRERAAEQEGLPVLTWIKTLSKTDAQAETTGGLVPYLRLTKSSLTDEDFQSWFRNEFFAGGAWVAGTFGKESVERMTVPFEVTVRDLNFGTEAMLVTHGGARQKKHSTPNTWLHLSLNLQNLLSLNDFTGKPVRLTRDDNGVYHLDIEAAADL